jgi:erythromycin esterase
MPLPQRGTDARDGGDGAHAGITGARSYPTVSWGALCCHLHPTGEPLGEHGRKAGVAMDSGASLELTDAAVMALRTLDPAAPLDDLEWLDEAIGDARVVAIGESAHGIREFYQLRHRFMRYLVERHGFDAYAMESGFVEGWGVNDWVHGGDDDLSRLLATGITFLMGLVVQMRAHLEWMRDHNRSAARPVSFYGADMPGSCVSLLPGIDAVIAYLGQADPAFEVDPSIRETAAAWAGNPPHAQASFAAYKDLTSASRNVVTAGLAELAARMTSRRLGYCTQTGTAAYERARQSLRVTVNLDAAIRERTRDPHGETAIRDASMAQTVEWIADRHDRIVVAAHNGHIQRRPVSVAGVPAFTPMGMHLADRLGDDYRVIGTTCGTGRTPITERDIGTGKMFTELEAPQTGSLDAVMAASHPGPFAVDLRRLSPADAITLRDVSQQRLAHLYCDISPLQAFDVVVHLPHINLADFDLSACAHAPEDIQRALREAKPDR